MTTLLGNAVVWSIYRMLRNDEHWLSLADQFQAAGVRGTGWYRALADLAEATGSRHGQLICIGDDATVPIDILTDVDPTFHDKFVAMGGGDPRINPRVRAGMNAPVLKVLAENDFIRPDEYRRDPHYQEFVIPHKVPYICLSTLDRTPGMLTGLAVVRDERQGHISESERAVFSSLAPHVRAAVRTQAALEGNGAALLAGAMEALAMPAFVCDRTGTVRELTPAAEQLAGAGRGLQLKEGRLRAALASDARELEDAIGAAAIGRVRPGPPPMHTVIVRSAEHDLAPIVLDVIALPPQTTEFSFMPRVLVVARGSKAANERRAAILQTAYGMTSAESDIALQLCSGKTPETIAAARKVAVGTVRAQIKALLAKAGVKRQIELVVRLNQL
jgi:DNA-binding CsgD family transcriptional regulator/PAS domain-containing protein